MTPLELQRTMHAQPDEVFRAWVEAERLARWFVPSSAFQVADVAVDARPGGGYRLDLRSPEGIDGSVSGKYEEVSAPSRLVFTLALSWRGAPATSTRVEVDIRPGDDGTEVRIVQHGLRDAAERSVFEHAWGACLARLPAALDEAIERFFGRLQSYPRFHSRFGGFWTDLDDVERRIAGKLELGLLDQAGAAALRHWSEKGYVTFERAVSEETIDRLNAELERLWETGHPDLRIESFGDGVRRFAPLEPRYRDEPHKVLDLHGYSAAARQVVFSAPVQTFLEQLFERPPLAFQSLLFTYGTEQDLHQDTAYVVLRSPLEFVGCWVALEDVEPGSGELQYYEGSHRIPEYLWFGRARAKPYDLEDDSEFLRWVREEPARRGLRLVRFTPRKGDALLWHADLVHGGSKVEQHGTTRRSFVTHLCPRDVDPEYFGTVRHSEKLRHGPRSYYCYRIRG